MFTFPVLPSSVRSMKHLCFCRCCRTEAFLDYSISFALPSLSSNPCRISQYLSNVTFIFISIHADVRGSERTLFGHHRWVVLTLLTPSESLEERRILREVTWHRCVGCTSWEWGMASQERSGIPGAWFLYIFITMWRTTFITQLLHFLSFSQYQVEKC